MTSKKQQTSVIRQNYTDEVEAAINQQINIKLYTSYVYLGMYFYFDRDDVNLQNIAKFFAQKSEEANDHAIKFMKHQNTRGGRIVLQNIQKPERNEWNNVLEVFEAALALEKFNNQSILNVHQIAKDAKDPEVNQ